MEISPKPERLGNVISAERNDEVVTLGQAKGFGLAPVKVYKALISQSGTDAPTAIIIQNTIGSIVWTRSNTGSYLGTLSGAFTENKTLCFGGVNAGSTMIVGLQRNDANSVALSSIDSSTSLGSDSLLYLTSILIEVYN